MGILTISFLSCLRIITAKSLAFFMISPHRLSTAERVGGTEGSGESSVSSCWCGPSARFSGAG